MNILVVTLFLVLAFPVSLLSKECGAILEEFNNGFISAQKFCAASGSEFDYVKYNTNNKFNYKMTYREDVGTSSRPVLLQYNLIEECFAKAKECKSICDKASEVQTSCAKIYDNKSAQPDTPGDNNKLGAVEQLDNFIKSSDSAIDCYNKSTTGCNSKSYDTIKECAVASEGVSRANGQCEGVLYDLLMFYRQKNCDSTDANEVIAFNKAKEKALEELDRYLNSTKAIGNERYSRFKDVRKLCDEAQVLANDKRLEATVVSGKASNDAVKARAKYKATGE